jgi:glutaredoxin
VGTVTLYGKPGCHLCHDAREAVRRVLLDRELRLEEVDITLDPVLFARYGERIPVLELDGEVLFQFVVDEDLLRQRLDRVTT